MSLREKAAALAAGTDQPAAQVAPAGPVPEFAGFVPEELPDVDIPEPPADGPEQVPVHVAWSRVMGTVRPVAKNESGTGINYKFRGVDRALNVFGPACRLHGVLVLPVKVEASYRDTRTSGNKPTRECTVIVTYRIIGPAGDFLEVQAAGESLDNGDKGSAKAQSVALRTLLYLGGLVPTGDPDPDSRNVERGEAPPRPAASYRDEALDPGTTRQRMHQMLYELRQLNRLGESVQNENGDDEQIGELITRVGRERFGGGQ
jgi:hypothetical protein